MVREIQRGESISEYCMSLCNHLISKGVEVEGICFDTQEQDEVHNGLFVHKVPLIIGADNMFNWVMLVNNEFKRKAREIFEERDFDLIHANDWVTASAGMSISKFTGKPLVMTLHSTEKERGFSGKHSSVIADLEWWATFEAKHVLANNKKTYDSLINDLKLPAEKATLIDIKKQEWQNDVLEIYKKITEEPIGVTV